MFFWIGRKGAGASPASRLGLNRSIFQTPIIRTPIRRQSLQRPAPLGRSIRRGSGLALIELLLVLAAGAAHAQDLFDRTENVTVQDRPRPEYDPLGLRVGVGFLLYPKVTLSETLDDNFVELPATDLLDTIAPGLPNPQRYTQFTDNMRPLADAQLSIEPNITLKSNWNQHSFQLTADAILDRSASHPDISFNYPAPGGAPFANSNQYAIDAAGVLNVRHDLTINVDASYGHKLLPRTFDGYVIVFTFPGALDVTASTAPLFANESDAKVEAIKDFSRFRLTLRGEFQGVDYPPGFGPTFRLPIQPSPVKPFLSVGPIGQAFHNHESYTEFGRIDYALSSDFALFVEQTVIESEYPNLHARNRFDEETIIGSNFQIPRVMTAEIGVGNLYGYVDFPGVKPIDTPTINANITYFPTHLTDLTLTASQYVVDSGIPQSPDFLNKNIGLEGNYELLRNLILTAKADADLEDYRAIDRHAKIYDQGLTATYLPNRGLRVALAYLHRQFDSTGAQAVARQFNEFNEDRVTLGFTLQH